MTACDKAERRSKRRKYFISLHNHFISLSIDYSLGKQHQTYIFFSMHMHQSFLVQPKTNYQLQKMTFYLIHTNVTCEHNLLPIPLHQLPQLKQKPLKMDKMTTQAVKSENFQPRNKINCLKNKCSLPLTGGLLTQLSDACSGTRNFGKSITLSRECEEGPCHRWSTFLEGHSFAGGIFKNYLFVYIGCTGSQLWLAGSRSLMRD